MSTPPTRPDPRRTFRGPASATLSMEAVAVLLVLPVMANVEGGITALKVAWVVVLAVGMVVAIARFSAPWALPLAVGLQVLMVLGWLVSSALGILGVVFVLVWALLLWMRREVIRRQAAWPVE